MNKTYANFILIFVTILWGGGFLATDGALDSMSPFYIMMIRFSGAALFPCFVCWKKLRQLSFQQVRNGCIVGIFLFLAFAFQTFGLKYTTPSKNAFLTATNVVFVPYLLWLLLKRKPTKKEMIASVGCVFGIALLTLRIDAFTINIGDVLSLICAVFFALHIISLERYSGYMDALCLTTLQMFSAAVLSIICALIFEQPPAMINSKAVVSVLYLIFVSTLLAFLLQTYAQKFTSANTASLILSMEALFATIFSFIFLHEVITLPMILGGCLILGSVIYIEYKPSKKK